MKNFYLFAVILSSLLTNAWAQVRKDKKEVPVAIDPFSKGNWNFTNKPNLSYTNFKSVVDGDPKSLQFSIDPSYFIANGLAIGIDARVLSTATKNTSAKYHSWMTDLTVMYGRKINNAMGIYVKVFAGTGHSESKFDPSGVGTDIRTLTAKYFDLKGMIGVPLNLAGDDAGFITPYISYDYLKANTSSTVDLKDYTLQFGFKLESFIRSGQTDHSKGMDMSNTAYQKGGHFLEFNTMGSINFNNHKQHQAGVSGQTGDVKTTNSAIGFGYNYYFLNNLAGGLNFNTSSRSYKDSPGSASSSWSLQPVITVQAPLEGAGHNLFLQGGFGFGGIKSGAVKKKTTDLSLRAGYNIFLTRLLTLTPKIGYEKIKATPKGNSGTLPYEDSGFAAEIGVRTWLNFWKW